MASAITLPVARLRAAGCKVGHVIGHDPYTGGSHPNGRPNWHYSVTLPEGKSGKDIEDLLYSWDHSWSGSFGEAITYAARDGRVIVYARQPEDDKVTTAKQHRAVRLEVERQVGVLLGRIATVISNGAV